ncbi:hypothetical protein GWC77_24115 [Paraburkholderia sp. NMBU_R16]|uniref:CesT family type III secretion system chaperone n=1 Tax=Paraburkholderia sp. NMBU_R16 TaxID=2698676 RepID=UPI0015670A27|nr:CesT family type III secretion system chaperone [Paraburkholderia sp. NMBU_R16]NRO98996.1 hypothetical protein [Paraburkholderia sp. NMBU_R16]
MSLEELISAACHDASAEERRTILETGGLMAYGVPFSLVPGGADDDLSLYVYCDFGAVPRSRVEAVLKRLLEINLFLYGRDTPSLVLNPTTGHILFACRMDMRSLTAQRFVLSLEEMSGYARQWRATHFLTDEEIGGQRPSFLASSEKVAFIGGRPR